MNKIITGFKLGIISLILLISAPNVFAAGLMSPANGSGSALDIREHHVAVTIEDGYAVTRVEQVFHNPSQKDLEANYSFPIPEKAAVAEFTVWIDGKPVTGEVLKKKQARQIYEEEKSAGNDAGLTEQDGYKTFEVFVTPVRAGKDTRIRLTYMQPVHIDTGIGRYVYPLEEGGIDEKKLAFWTANETVKEKFSFNLNLRSSYPVEALRAPNQPNAIIRSLDDQQHQISIGNSTNQLDPAIGQENEVATDDEAQLAENMQPQNNSSAFELNKDIVVYWRHTAGLAGSVDLVTYKPDTAKQGTFMLTITPGDDLKPITEGKDWAFVLDISGSMSGGKLSSLIDGVQQAIRAMQPEDRFRIILFSDNAHEMTEGYTPATAKNVSHYVNLLQQQQTAGGTNLYAGLERGLKSLDADRTASIILVTDGVANVGITEKTKFLKLVSKKDVRLFTFIMSNSANRPLLNAITRKSGGFSANVSNSDDISGQMLLAASKVTHEALHDVKVSINGIKVTDLTDKHISSLYRGQQIMLFGHYRGDGEATVSVKGKISGENKTYSTKFNFPNTSSLNPEIERLWAFAQIEQMQQLNNDFGEQADLKDGITDLALEYSIVTDYTSMLVVRDEVFTKHGVKRKNLKRLSVEEAAQLTRSQAPVVNHRVDTQQPMYSQPRASTHSGGGSGGGAMGPFWLLLTLPLVLLRRKR